MAFESAFPVIVGGLSGIDGFALFGARKHDDVIQDQYLQLNFVICQLLALAFSFPFRVVFGPDKCSAHTRHVLEFFAGSAMAIFCFGQQAVHLFVQSAVSYVIMAMLPSRLSCRLVFLFAMGYLWITHAYRLYYDYGGYILDITGPLMINTQRVTSIAFAVRDGNRDLKKNVDIMIKKHQLRFLPHALEYFSYMMSFHTLMCGPFVFFKDYKSFIEGKNLPPAEKPSQINARTNTVVMKIAQAALALFMLMVVLPIWDPTYMFDSSFYSMGFLEMNFYILMATSLTRQKYYFAWKFAEAINVNCGLGFNNYDSKGQQKWDLVDGANILKVELSTSFKMLLDNWNITTTHWLRYIVYSRYKSTLLVFALSAVWHGFYPGYYLTFFTGALYTIASRLVRSNVRPFCQKNEASKQVYDTFTLLVCRVAVAYLTFPFILLQLSTSLKVYNSLYWFGHIIAVMLVVVFGAASYGKKPKDIRRDSVGEKIVTTRGEVRRMRDRDTELEDGSSTSSASAGSSVDTRDTMSHTSFVF